MPARWRPRDVVGGSNFLVRTCLRQIRTPSIRRREFLLEACFGQWHDLQQLQQDPKPSVFPATQWNELGGAAAGRTEDLDRLIRQYWAPLRIFFAATFPRLRGDADSWLQDFAEDKMMKAGWLARADRDRGRFRDFLKTSLRNFVLDRLNLAAARHAPVSLEGDEAALPRDPPPSEAFDLMWVRTVLGETLKRMEQDCRNPAGDQPRRTFIWEMFTARLLDPIFNDAEPPPYSELIGRFRLVSPTDASNLLLSGKRIFKNHLNRVIQEYAGMDSATAAEVRALEEFVAGLADRD